MGKRDARILEILTDRKRVEVAELARELGVSSVTMRKDLDELESRDVIQRRHGYAVLGNPNDINGRLAFHYESKRAIAERAMELVRDGETVMVESGSCCALLALALVEAERASAIVTNSAFIASYVRKNRSANTILLGGAFQNDAQVTVGPLVAQSAQSFNVDHLFIGIDGYSLETGFANADHLRAQAVRDMAERAKAVVALTESEKFGRTGVVPLGLEGKIKAVITDDGIPDGARLALATGGVEVIEVPRRG